MSIVAMADIMCACFMGISLVSQFADFSTGKSEKNLRICCILMFIWAILDAAAYVLNGAAVPDLLLWVVNFSAYTWGPIVFVSFVQYCYCYISDRCSIQKWVFMVPVFSALVIEAVTIKEFFSGNIVVVENGAAVVTGGIPDSALLLNLVMLLYLPIIAVLKRRDIGLKAVTMLGLYGIAPILAIFVLIRTGRDYTVAMSAVAIIIVATLLEREETRKKIEQSNIELKNANNSLSRNLNIIGSISHFFSAIFYIDLKDYSFIEIYESEIETVRRYSRIARDAKEAFRLICDNAIAEESRQEVSEFMDVTTLTERLGDCDTISAQFVGSTAGWVEGSFIAANRDENGRCTHVLWTVRSIQEQKEKDLRYQKELEAAKTAAEDANLAKTSFLFNMSHDIRTPMNAITGFRNLLEKHQEDPEKRADYLKKIKDSSNVLLSIIDNVLEMARIEKGTVEMDETAWSAEQFNDTLYSIFHEMMEQKGIRFTRNIDVQNNYVFCDPIKLRKIFINILTNAYKYTNQGGTVFMHLEEVPSNREGYAMYRTTITDTGIGISEEFLPHIFEEFARENSTTDAKVEGTGLGMSIVKKLVDLMQGTIEVKSAKGIGTTFVVTLPHRIAEKNDLVDHAGVKVDPKLFAGKRILLAEDNDLNAEIAAEILSDAGFVVDRVEDGAVCLEKLKAAEAGAYDLVLMDIQMPNLNGYDAAKAIRSLEDTRKAHIKILAMTANAFEEDRREAFRSGMDGHLAKPINVHELMKTLTSVLG